MSDADISLFFTSDPCGDLFHGGSMYKKTTGVTATQAFAGMWSDTLAIAEYT